MWNLVFKNNYGELEKARVIFRWLTSKDLKSICLASEVPELPERILNDFGSGKGSYARAFELMARYSGLYAVSIKGWAKGIDYSVGSDVTSDPVNHSWNAVYVNGSWQLLDCSWASLRSRGTEDAPSAGFDDFYFLTDPAEMIYSHFPENAAWQLLATAQSNLDYERHPHVKSHFFTLGLRLLEQNSGLLHTENGVLTLTLGFTRQTAFTYKITFGDDNAEQVREVRLSRYLIQEMTKDRLTYYFRAPAAGTYRLTIFARDASDGIPKGNIVFRSVAEYKIVCPEAVHDFGPFPYCSDSSWGADVYTQQYPIIPSIKTAILITSTGKAEVAFVKDEKLKLYARLVRDGLSFEELKSWLSFDDGKNQTVLRINIKLPGEYGLEIFANDPGADGEIYTHFSQYLIVSSGREFSAIFGSVFDRDDLAAQETLKHETHKEPKYESSDAMNGEESATTKGPNEDDVRQKLYASVVTAEAPSGFEAAPVSDKDFAAKRPSESYRPVKLFDDVAIFKAVDGHSVEVSKVEHGNFRDLIWHLIYARNITDELEKARAIFVFLSSKDLSKINFGRVERDSPEEMLMNLKDGRTTYARVYETLCSYAGLNCDTVTGFAKGADYRPDMHFSGDEGQHSWNAVFVNGTWQLVDCHWAARRLVGKQVAGDNVRYELDNYYFMPASSQLIFTHYPLVAIWQLLERPVTLEEFENLVPIKSAFFKYGLSVVSHRNAIIHVEEGELTIVIGCSKGSNLAFTFNLAHYEIGEDYHGVPLNQFAMNYQLEGNSCFRVRLPESGSYQLVIYAKETTPSQDTGGMFSGVCEYEIISGKPQSNPLPFPPCAHNTWGPGDSYHDYNVTPLQKGVIIETVNGTAEVRMSTRDELRFTAKLKSALVDDDTQLAPFLVQRLVGDVAVFSIRAPLAGEFGLEIYANNPLVDGQSLHHVYQYLILCNEPFSGEPFPPLPPSYLGPQPQFKPLGLAVAGSPDPLIVVEGGELHLSFATAQPTRMSCQLIFCSDGGDRDYSEYSLQQSDGATITYVVKLPQPGFYKAQFFALPASDASESLPGVYNSLIDCRSTFVSSTPFPKQYGIWRDGCYLYEPLDGHLQPNRPSKGGASTYQHVFFSIDVPRATSVAVVVGEDWFPLDQKPDSISWRGEVQMDGFWGRERKLSVVTSFDDPPSRYGTLLEYSM